MRYLVLGAGVGKGIALFLSRVKSTDHLVLADMDMAKAKSACDVINRLEPHVFCLPTQCDSEKITRHLLAEYDTVISALPAEYNYMLADRSIDVGVNFCDLGGVVSVTEKMMAELNEKAEKNCVSVVPDCGIMPGLGIMLAKIFVDDMVSAKNAYIYVGGIPQKPRPPLYYDRVFNISGVESICYDPVPVLENGRIVMKDPFSDLENFRVKELADFSPDGYGTVEAFNTAGASVAHNTFHDLKLKNFREKTVRWPKFAEIVGKIPRNEFVKRVGSLINRPIDPDNPDLLWMKVVVSGMNADKKYERTATLLELLDQNSGLTAMEKCTAFPTAIIAKYLARHEAAFGVKTPENAFEVYQLKQMVEELKKHLHLKIGCKAV